MIEDDDLLLRVWAADIEPTPHPTSDILTTYAMSDLSPDKAAEVLEHTATCQQCSDILIQLGDLSNLDEEPLPITDPAEIKAGLQDLGVVPVPLEHPGWMERWLVKLLPMLVPAFTLVLGILIGNELQGPDAMPNIAIVDLYAKQDIVRGFGEEKKIPVAGYCVLILNPPIEVDSSLDYQVEVRDEGGAVLSTVTLRPTADGNFTLGLTEDIRAQGHEIQLFIGDAKTPIAYFGLSVAGKALS